MLNSLTILMRQFAEDVTDRLRRLCARWIRKIAEVVIRDLELMGALRDVTSSAEFARQHFRDVPEFKNRDQLFRWALDQTPSAEGLFLEFGVYKGDSINRLAGSFVGLPEGWTLRAKTGAFDVQGVLPPVRNNVVLVKGFFEARLEDFLRAHPDRQISFLHIDCDLYSATKTVFSHAKARLVQGAVVVFDEFFNYPGWKEHEYKAFMEFVAETNRNFEYIGYVRNGAQVAVKLL